MATWQELAKDSRTAAWEGFEGQRWRTCVSRSYYAVYSVATDAVIGAGVTMPAGRGNPSHARLPTIIGNNLKQLKEPTRWKLSSFVDELYKLRLMADYMPQIAVEEDEARVALGLMHNAFACLKGTS